MSFGSVQTIVACVSVASATPAQQVVCPKVGAVFYAPTRIQAYVVDVSQQSNLEAAMGPFDYSYAAALWGLSFTVVVTLYFVSNVIGSVLGLIRRG